MKKTLLFTILIASLLSSVCSGELLNTALSIGEGNMAIQGFYASNSLAGDAASQFGPKIIYGITNDFEIVGKLGMGTWISKSSTTLGVGGKYTFVRANKQTPVDIAGFINYETASSTGLTLSTMAFGAIFSKAVRKDIQLYGILGITNVTYDWKETVGTVTFKTSFASSALTLGGGIKYIVNKDVSLLGEISTYSADGSAFSTFALAGQFAI